MQAVSTIAEVREQVRQWRREGLTISQIGRASCRERV